MVGIEKCTRPTSTPRSVNSMRHRPGDHGVAEDEDPGVRPHDGAGEERRQRQHEERRAHARRGRARERVGHRVGGDEGERGGGDG